VTTLSTRRIGCASAATYAQGLTLAETGRILREHEATVSADTSLERGRRFEARSSAGFATRQVLSDAQISECFAACLQMPARSTSTGCWPCRPTARKSRPIVQDDEADVTNQKPDRDATNRSAARRSSHA
jgi:hypothetical protein